MIGKGLLTLAACLAFGLLAIPASANYHLMKIREISGSTAGTNSAYIELQMHAAGQNQVSGHNITIWDADAFVVGPNPVATLPLSGPNPPNGQTQRTILIGDTGVPGSDFTLELSPYLETGVGGNLLAAGAVCFEAIPVDCVSWGGAGFTGSSTGRLPDLSAPYGQPLPTTFGLRRKITAGCATLLEAADDTNNNVNDFAPATPRDPTNNATTPIEKACGGGTTPPPGSDIRCNGKPATLIGSPGKDNITGTGKRDVIVAFAGVDTVNGRGGNDLLCGNGGKDNLNGGKGKDVLVGGAGPDKLLGGAGGDTLIGQKGNDVCNGGGGTDVTKTC